jgi:WSC domain
MFVVRPLAISLSLASVLGATTAACSLIFGFDHFGDGTGAPCVGACDSGGGADVEQAADVRETASPPPTGEGGADGSPLLDAGADAGADSAIGDAGSGAEDAGEERGADANETGSPPIYIGCFQDSMTRDLPYEAYDSPVNTNEACVSTCSVQGFRYAATQAGGQCFCGNAFGGQGPAGDCVEPCSGDPSELCGNTYENSVYAVQAPPPKPTYLGCFADMSSRDLPDFVYASSYNTTETCAFACAYHGYAYAGAQGRAQCFCGETYGAYGPANDCTLTCPGDATEMCGGNYANSVYRTSAPLDAGPPADGSAE